MKPILFNTEMVRAILAGRNYNDQESSLVVSRQPLKDPES